MTDSTPNTLLIFVKNPREGRVKTRLAATIGDSRAVEIYKELLAITKSVADGVEANRQVWYSDFIDEDDLWSHGDYEKHLQQGKGLGKRMKEAFRKAFESEKQKVVIIGSDCAELTSDTIHQAYHLLEEEEVVVGPSQDGGYYLLGMSSFYPQLFEQKDWSTSSVCSQTISQLKAEGIPYRLLPERNDIDTELDLQQSRLS